MPYSVNNPPVRLRSQIVTTELQLKRLAKKMKKLQEFAFDTETNTLRVLGPNNDFTFVGISISWGTLHNYYIPVGHYFDEDQLPLHHVVKILKPIFENPNIRIIGHGLKFDMHVLTRIGIVIKTLDLFDTMIASWLCDENSPNGLKPCTERVFGIKQDKFGDVLSTITKEDKKLAGIPTNSKGTYDLVRYVKGAPYALDDSFYTWCLYLHYLDELKRESVEKNYFRNYPRFIRALYKMEERGIDIDYDKLEEMDKLLIKDTEDLLYDIYEAVGVEFNPNSAQQLAEVLYGFDGSQHLVANKQTGEMEPIYKNPNKNLLAVAFNFPIDGTTGKGAPQSSAEMLENITKKDYKTAHKKAGVQVVRKLLAYKKMLKLKSSFIDGIRENAYSDKKIHASCNIIGTTSGRISMSEPNLQQLPKSLEEDESGIYDLVLKYKIRDLFIGSMNKRTGKRNKIISLDKHIVQLKPCELQELLKAV